MVAGPFIDHLDAFERMETLEKRSLFRRAAFAVVWPIAVVIAVATLIE
jgi:hypothetical protein